MFRTATGCGKNVKVITVLSFSALLGSAYACSNAPDAASQRDSGVPQSGEDGDIVAAGDGGPGSTGDAGLGEAGALDSSAGAARGPALVNLGSTTSAAAAGSYVLLAKTAITNVTGSSITGGQVGLSPAAAAFITGFGLVADPSNVFATSASVNAPARIYAADYAPPTPSNLTTAVLAMQAAYTDAAGRVNPDFLNLGSGNIGGQTLAPGLYTWGTGVTVPADVTFAGGAGDVWILQIAQDLDVSAAKAVVLSGGGQAKNIVWQVAGAVTIHASAHFEGIILSQTAITLQTGASMRGRALAQSLIALDNNVITAP